MATKKKSKEIPEDEATQNVETQEKKAAKTKKSADEMPVDPTAEVKQNDISKKSDLVVTNNGGLVTHAHWYKAKDSDQMYFTAKVDGVPLKPQRFDPADAEAFREKKTNLGELFGKYYPTKVMPRYVDEDYKFPQQMQTSEGVMTVYKFNVYKNTDVGPNQGKYMFFAQIDGKNMSAPAAHDDLNNYFDHTRLPKDQIIKSFGDRLGLKEHYEQFQLPANLNIEEGAIKIMKNKDSNSRFIQVNLADGEKINRTMSYYDTTSFFAGKVTREQLAAKYMGKELSSMGVSSMGVKSSVKQEKKSALKV